MSPYVAYVLHWMPFLRDIRCLCVFHCLYPRFPSHAPVFGSDPLAIYHIFALVYGEPCKQKMATT